MELKKEGPWLGELRPKSIKEGKKTRGQGENGSGAKRGEETGFFQGGNAGEVYKNLCEATAAKG